MSPGFSPARFWSTASRTSCRAFPATNSRTPFATPRGVGESSAVINVIWGFANLVIGSVLVHVTWPAPSPPWQLCLTALIGALALALYLCAAFLQRTQRPAAALRLDAIAWG